WQSKPIDGLVAIITGGCGDTKTNLRPSASEFFYVWQISDNDIGSGCPGWKFGAGRPVERWHHDGFGFSTDKLCDLDRLHRRAHRNPADVCTDVLWSPEHLRELIREQEPSTLHGQQLRSSIVLEFVSLHVEKCQTRPGVAHGEIEGRAVRKFLEDE